MPLLEHFGPPLWPNHHWEGFHALWSAGIVEQLNLGLLPEGYFAEAQTHIGGRVEVDVATFDAGGREVRGSGGAAVGADPRVWVAPAPTATLPAVFPDSVEVLVYSDEGGAVLAAAIELVSPGNKDREQTRKGFVAKCASYLQQGVGLVIVDVVTSRRGNLHDELADFLGGSCPMLAGTSLYASAYRPVRREDAERHDVWTIRLAVGSPLPTLPLALRGGPVLPLDLDASYGVARRRSRLN